MALSFAEFLGYLASVLVFVTFYMKTMVPLRCVAIASNVAFISYAYYKGLLPIFILHGLLLPMNLYRLSQLRRLVSDSALLRQSGFPVEPLIPFMTEQRVHSGEVLFSKGDHSRGMYYIAKGRIRVPEVGAYLGPGDILGEISLFAPDRARTASAVCEDDGIVYWLSEANVLKIFQQSPRFGVSLVRAITARLVDHCQRLEGDPDAEAAQAPGGVAADFAARSGQAERRQKADRAEAIMRRSTRRRRVRRVAMVVVPLVLLSATIYSGQAYLASLVFRDAVVTSWVHTATSPISGKVKGPVPEPGDVYSAVRAPVLAVFNPRADDTEVTRLAAEIGRTRERIEQLEAQRAEMRATLESWNERTAVYGGVFQENLRLELSGLRAQLEHIERQLELSVRVAERVKTLARSGNMAASTADETEAEIVALRSQKVALEKRLERTKRRWEAARQGVFTTPAGDNPGWVLDGSDQLELRIIETEEAIAEAKSRLRQLRTEHRAAQAHYERMSRAGIKIPTGARIWSVPAGPETTVGKAAPLLRWIDCTRTLVDVPVADSSLGLFPEGMPARVHVDGMSDPISGTVIYTRGAAARLDNSDLAAVSGSSSNGSAQVIVSLDGDVIGAGQCLVGRSAYVDFPDVGPIEQVRAFLRL